MKAGGVVVAIVLGAAPAAAPAAAADPSAWCHALTAGAGAATPCPYAHGAKPSHGTDYAAAFDDRHACTSGGSLWMPTGALVAADPFVFLERAPAFTRRVLPGVYPVFVVRVQDQNALALIRFGAARPVRWVHAYLPGEDTSRTYGYPVDAGTGCYADVATAPRILALDQERPQSSSGDTWMFGALEDRGLFKTQIANLCLDDTGDNLVAFSSGEGDGSYPVWWGLDAHGVVVAAITDFGLRDPAP